LNLLVLLIAALLAVAQLALPRKFAFVPLLIAACHLGNGEILPQLSPSRLLILLGLLRAITQGFFTFSPKNSLLDRWFIVLSIAALVSTVGHSGSPYIPSPFNARAGLVFNILGVYIYSRSYLPDYASFQRFALILPLILIPLALAMTFEKRTRINLYYILGARSDGAPVREDKVRATGPFQHPILAGCCGATALPFAYLTWLWGRRKAAILGGLACFTVVLACSSSGPLAAVAVGFAGLAFWRWRRFTKHLLWFMVGFALVYSIAKGRGPWYLMASIDLVGGSTGWHRAKLIDQGVNYLGDWWLWGTDYTRHWIASGTRWNPNMVDITNYYLQLGVTGGMPLMLSLMAIIACALRSLTVAMAPLRLRSDPKEWALWLTGVAITTHAVSFVSISYFDQMYVLFYLVIGIVPGLINSLSSLPDAPLASREIETSPVKRLSYYS